ncbi:MAG: acireductone synthase [Pirellulaceae bacterium]
MIDHASRAILLDIEGTTSSVRFVYDVMFPFARKHLDLYLDSQWDSDECRAACEQVAHDAGHDSLAAWCEQAAAHDGGELDVATSQRRLVRDEIVRLMDGDVKATGLKQLQGLIWRGGFESGELQAHVYDDVPPALDAWRQAGCDVRIYSSGSVQAQKLFFGHTIAGDLLDRFRGHYDTTTGPKREAESYKKIAAEFGLPPSDILFLSDVVEELDAARAAGLKTGLLRRPGNAEPPAEHGHDELTDFTQVRLVKG